MDTAGEAKPKDAMSAEHCAYVGLVLAGGRGERLRPLTDRIPKPLLRIRGRTLLDGTLDRFEAAGIARVYVATCYRAGQVERRLAARSKPRVTAIRELHGLGTAGALALLPELSPVVVMNADLVTDLDLRELVRTHEAAEADVTVALAAHRIPYGVATGCATGDLLEEKPVVWINAGAYVLSKAVVEGCRTSSAHRQDMPQIVNRVRMNGRAVATYRHPGKWADVGTAEELARARR